MVKSRFFISGLISFIILFLTTFIGGKPIAAEDRIKFHDAKNVISTTLKTFYKPLDSKQLTSEFYSGICNALRTIGDEGFVTDLNFTGKPDEDIDTIKATLEKASLSPKLRSSIIFTGLSKMFESLNDNGTKIEAPEKRYKSLKEMGYDKGGAGFFLDDQKDESGRFVVIETLPGFPMEKSGIQTGDRVIMIDGDPVKNISYKEIADLIRGPIGTDVSITFERPGDKKVRTCTINRRWLAPNFKSIESELINNKILYMRIKFMGENLEREFLRILKSYEEKGIKRILLDLRNNGGKLEGGRDFAGFFLPQGTILYSVIKRNGSEVIRSHGKQLPDLPMVILVNKKTGSPSELFAGILQEYKKAIIVGTEPSWNENIDESFTLPDGSTCTITTGYYLLPKGKVLMSKNGIKPDVIVNQDPFIKYSKQNDKQLQKALEILSHL